ncbi:MAG: orotidine-5'-phosphate decarboxylase [Coriobacteriia bacterium]|nr:orotidine-5'-phosphate decarboxylase [Coriobacteriia bacterium]
MNSSNQIIVALDTEPELARALARKLQGRADWLKVGMTLYYAAGPAIIAEFKDMGFKVFVDLKLHDIPHQVEGAARVIAKAGANMITAHAAGGASMMQAVCKGASEGFIERFADDNASEALSKNERPICLAITVLTSLGASALATTGVTIDPARQALNMAALAKGAGMDGIVCSPKEVGQIRQKAGEGFVLVTPGVRPAGSQKGDQARTANPSEALAAGSDYLVIGRPITDAPDPLAAFDAICKEIQ